MEKSNIKELNKDDNPIIENFKRSSKKSSKKASKKDSKKSSKKASKKKKKASKKASKKKKKASKKASKKKTSNRSSSRRTTSKSSSENSSTNSKPKGLIEGLLWYFPFFVRWPLQFFYWMIKKGFSNPLYIAGLFIIFTIIKRVVKNNTFDWSNYATNEDF